MNEPTYLNHHLINKDQTKDADDKHHYYECKICKVYLIFYPDGVFRPWVYNETLMGLSCEEVLVKRILNE